MSRVRCDHGVGTVLGLALGLVLLASGAVVCALVAIAVGHQRAAVAADLTAVAAAARGCAEAQRVAVGQGAVSVACRAEGGDAVVTVAIPAPEFLARLARWSGHEAPVLASTSRAGLLGD
jgi:secretion/DNA translocation related TadE-like protein